MRRRSIGGAALLALVAACESTGPGNKELADFLLDFCTGETPAFVAFQNEGGPWTRVTPDASGTVVMQTTPKFGLAVAGQVGASPFVDVVYGTREEFAGLNGMSCLEGTGAKTLNLAATGVSASELVAAVMAESFATVPGPNPQLQLTGLPSRPLDLVAYRAPSAAGSPPDRIVVYRALGFASGETLLLSFATVSAPASNTLTVSGLVSGESNTYYIAFTTLSGTTSSLAVASFSSASPNQPLYGVPALLTQSGDVHEIGVSAQSVTNNTLATRGVVQYHRDASNRTAALGAALNAPVVTSTATAPSLLMRAQLASQADYGAFASVNFMQETATDSRNFSVTRTSGYAGGTPTTWELEMPDLSGVTGFPSTAAFVNGSPVFWFAEAGSAGSIVFIGGAGTDGTIVKFADLSSSAAATQLARAPGAAPAQRKRLIRTFLSRLH